MYLLSALTLSTLALHNSSEVHCSLYRWMRHDVVAMSKQTYREGFANVCGSVRSHAVLHHVLLHVCKSQYILEHYWSRLYKVKIELS